VEWYARAEDYDLWYSWDPAKERDFVLGASERWGIREPRRFFEPMCGSGRLLRTMPGWCVGLDREPAMLQIAGRTNPVVRADAAQLPFRAESFDLAFNLIDSFRHLPTERDALSHLAGVAHALRPGAVYVLGLEVRVEFPGAALRDEWSSARDGATIRGFIEELGDAHPDRRQETLRIVYERGGIKHEFFEIMRTYTPRQIEDLIDEQGSFELVTVADCDLDLDRPRELSAIEGSAVLVLRVGCKEIPSDLTAP
jgi:SAM-dependent methyltransferase